MILILILILTQKSVTANKCWKGIQEWYLERLNPEASINFQKLSRNCKIYSKDIHGTLIDRQQFDDVKEQSYRRRML